MEGNKKTIFEKLNVSKEEAAKEILRVKAMPIKTKWNEYDYDWDDNARLSMIRALKRERYPGFT